jgi:hypothetical protein
MPFFRSLRSLALLLLLQVAWPLYAQDLAATCHTTSSYDFTVKTDSMLFDRAAPAPFRVELQQGALRTDGVAVTLNAEDQDRMALFERDLRALVPRVRTVADNGVDMAMQALRAEEAGMGLGAETRAEFERRLQAHASELKQRIARSQSTHDWHGEAATQYANQIAADLAPLLVADLGQQAINAALSGDLQTAADLRDRAAGLATELQPRLLKRMQALRPQIQALCPDVRRLAELQQGVRGAEGHPLDLLQIDQPAAAR